MKAFSIDGVASDVLLSCGVDGAQGPVEIEKGSGVIAQGIQEAACGTDWGNQDRNINAARGSLGDACAEALAINASSIFITMVRASLFVLAQFAEFSWTS